MADEIGQPEFAFANPRRMKYAGHFICCLSGDIIDVHDLLASGLQFVWKAFPTFEDGSPSSYLPRLYRQGPGAVIAT